MLKRLFVVLLLLAFGSAALDVAQAQLRGHGGPVRALVISPDGSEAVSGSFDTSAIRWSLIRNVAEQVMRYHDGAVNAVAWLKGGRIVTAGADAHIAIWTPGKPKPIKCSTAIAVQSPLSLSHRTERGSHPVRGITAFGFGRSPPARRACWKATARTSTASPSRPMAARW